MIRYATILDRDFLLKADKHISYDELSYAIERQRILIAEDDCPVAWLRYNLFWDNTPFCNMLYVLEHYRNDGIGKALVTAWEADMAQRGYTSVMTSTQENENGQYFWRKMGYADCGNFTTDDGKELILSKKFTK